MRDNVRGEAASPRPRASSATGPVAGLLALVSDGVDLRATVEVFFVHERVREAVKVADAQAASKVWPALLIFDDEIAHTLVLSKEGLRDDAACVGGVVDRRVTEFGLGVGMEPMAHASRVRTLASASSPGTILTWPALTSAWRR